MPGWSHNTVSLSNSEVLYRTFCFFRQIKICVNFLFFSHDRINCGKTSSNRNLSTQKGPFTLIIVFVKVVIGIIFSQIFTTIPNFANMIPRVHPFYTVLDLVRCHFYLDSFHFICWEQLVLDKILIDCFYAQGYFWWYKICLFVLFKICLDIQGVLIVIVSIIMKQHSFVVNK